MNKNALIIICAVLSACSDDVSPTRLMVAGTPPAEVPAGLIDAPSHGRRLLVLNSEAGICSKGLILDRWIVSGRARESNGELSVWDGKTSRKVKFSVGRFSVPGLQLRDAQVGGSRRVKIGSEGGQALIVVSEFGGAGEESVWIPFSDQSPESKAAAFLVASSVVACSVAEPAGPTSTK